MGLDTQPLLRQRATVCGRDEYIGHHVQKTGHIKYGYRPLHQLVISTMDHQAVLEPDR